MYHISDLKKYLRCERLYFYSRDESSSYRPYLRSDKNIIDLLTSYFGFTNYFEGIRNDPTDRFFNEMYNYEWYIHPRFMDGEMRINIPFMHRLENGSFDLCFVYYNTFIKELDLITYRTSVKVLERLGLRVNDIYIVYFNENYVNEGTIDVQQLFVCTEKYQKRKIIDIVREKDFDYDHLINELSNFSIEKNKAKKCRYCKLNGLCEYYDKCFPDEMKDPDDSILSLVSSKNKNKMYQNGIRTLKDADPKWLEGNKVQYAQIMASRNGGLFLDRLALGEWLKKLDYRPISFIDFEWDRYLVPEYYKMKPMDVICFEFALYYIDKKGHMEHRTFVGTGDCRKEFVEALIGYLPEKGPILAYNAIGAEVLRLQELADIFPEYSNKLKKIIDRFVDLAEPFSEGLVYDVRMQGNFTLKKLVDICSDYSYKDLDIYDGMEAVFNWRDIEKADNEEGNKIVENLKEYCSLDAYGLFLVYRWLIKLMIGSK